MGFEASMWLLMLASRVEALLVEGWGGILGVEGDMMERNT